MLPAKHILLLLFLAVRACHVDVMYKHVHRLADNIFPREPPVIFHFPIQDITQVYTVYLLLTATPQYPYQNFYVSYTLQDSTAVPWATELCNYDLFVPKTGKPLGKGWGERKQHEFVLLKNYTFAQPGEYTLALTQFMRQEALPGISNVGIKICKTKPATT